MLRDWFGAQGHCADLVPTMPFASLSSEVLVGGAGFDLVHPDDQELALASFGTMQHTGLGAPVELRVWSSDGWELVEQVGSNLADAPSADAQSDRSVRRTHS